MLSCSIESCVSLRGSQVEYHSLPIPKGSLEPHYVESTSEAHFWYRARSHPNILTLVRAPRQIIKFAYFAEELPGQSDVHSVEYHYVLDGPHVFRVELVVNQFGHCVPPASPSAITPSRCAVRRCFAVQSRTGIRIRQDLAPRLRLMPTPLAYLRRHFSPIPNSRPMVSKESAGRLRTASRAIFTRTGLIGAIIMSTSCSYLNTGKPVYTGN